MPNATGITEASFTSKPSGIGQAALAGTARNSACETNALLVATFWPTLRLRTSEPTSTISPAAW